MDKSAVKDYLLERGHEAVPEMVPRELKIPREEKFAVAVVGPRRSGKTYFFYQLMKEAGLKDSLYLNFEDTRLVDVGFREIRDVLRLYAEQTGGMPKNLFFDEIQSVDRWENAVRELFDTRRYRIYLTGSSSKLLSKEAATQMRGRSLTYWFLPFSFREFLLAKKVPAGDVTLDQAGIIKHHLGEYLEYGGFPDVVYSSQKEKILKEYFDAILYKDVIERHSVRNLHLVNQIFRQLVTSYSKEFSIHAMYQFFKSQNVKVSRDTINKYVNFFDDSVSVFTLKRHSDKPKQKEAWPRKVYLSDTGLSKVMRSADDIGRLMENAVFLELQRKKNKRSLLEIMYYKDPQGKEVDFLLKEAGETKELMQVAYSSSKEDLRDAETKNLHAAAKKLGCENKTIVTWDYEGEKDGIKYAPMWKWLLEPL